MILIIMGVTGSGKTTIGRMLAEQLGWQFADADEFHPAANVEKMRQGMALDDDDRRPWLERLRAEIINWIAQGDNVVLACSALKRSYRALLDAAPQVRFVYLKGSAQLIGERLSARHGHFAGAQILPGQFADLEEPEDSLTIDIAATPLEIVREIRAGLGLA